MNGIKRLVLVFAMSVCAPALGDSIDDFVRAEIERQGVPGVAVGIFRNGQPVRVQGFGLANIEHHVPVHPDTIFQSGSIGKLFTAAAAMLLVEDGMLDLDASVRRYLPDAPASWEAITPRHLLNHTAGLGRTRLELQREYTDEEFLQRYYATPLEFQPGRRWAYSNPGYAVLGILVNKVAGRHYGEVLRERIFEPAGMRTARVISDRDIVPNRAAGYEDSDAGLKNQQWVGASHNASAEGSLYLSLLDYAQWDAVVARRGLLKPESWREILRPASLSGGGTYPYGFGWQLGETAEGTRVIGHGGTWQGFRTDMRRHDEDGVTVVVLANARHADVGRIRQGVAERYDERYRETHERPLADGQTALTRRLRETLADIAAGNAKPEDFPGMDPRRAARALEHARTTLAQAGACGELGLTEHQPNGDRIERTYRADCARQAVVVSAVFDAEAGRPVSVWTRPQ